MGRWLILESCHGGHMGSTWVTLGTQVVEVLACVVLLIIDS